MPRLFELSKRDEALPNNHYRVKQVPASDCKAVSKPSKEMSPRVTASLSSTSIDRLLGESPLFFDKGCGGSW